MKNEQLYNKTVDILVQAYFNDTLEHDNCYACAVGNLVAVGCNYTIVNSRSGIKFWEEGTPFWDNVFVSAFGEQKECPEMYIGTAKLQIDSTGYKYNELAKIEFAFESASKGLCEEDYMFNGLMAVIEVLDEIHENTEPLVTKFSKNKFNKQLAK